MKVGILGGTFDPIHNTHIYMAQKALKEISLDRVYIMPSFNPPHKNANKITSEYHRINMIKLAINNIDNIYYSSFEIDNKLSYTADTLTALKSEHPDDELYFIIGGDSIATFESWYHPEIILKKASIVVIKRDDQSFENIEEIVNTLKLKYPKELSNKEHGDIIILDTKVSNISSSFIRSNSLEKCKQMVPNAVYTYIKENNLYLNDNKNTAWSVIEIKNDLKKVLNEHRYNHTLGVAQTAKSMAEVFDVNPNLAYLAGLLHDCAKHFSNKELLEFAIKNMIPISIYEQNAPHLLHGKIGAYIAKNKYKIEVLDVLNAIKWHTTGKANMTKLEQIIFCADYIEPGRNVQPNLSYLREISHKDLDLLTFNILKDTLEYLKTKEQIIDNHTVEAYEFYKKKIGEK